jgi:elongation factor Ts
MVIRSEEISEETIEKEREIYTSQAQESGKPADIVEKMVEGRIKKFLSEVSLVDQPFVKEPDRKVGDLLNSANSEVISFYRLEVGEGIEIEEEDFAAEVAAQLKGSQ